MAPFTLASRTARPAIVAHRSTKKATARLPAPPRVASVEPAGGARADAEAAPPTAWAPVKPTLRDLATRNNLSLLSGRMAMM